MEDTEYLGVFFLAPRRTVGQWRAMPALLLTAVFFGLPHHYGFPPGIGGPILTGFLAWLLGKAMLETMGFPWRWVIHVAPDVVIFFSYALLMVQS
jgi:hypothetical protein